MMDNLLESVKLKEIALIGDGAHASLKRENSGILYLTSKNFKQDGISLDTVDYISEETYQKYFKEKSKALTKPRENDILLSIIGTMGAPYIVKKDDIFGLSSSVSIIRPNNEIVDSKYLYYWIKSPMFQGSIESIKSGVAQSFLSLPMIGSLPIKYPKDLNHQKKIAKILSNYDDLIENNLKQIKLLEEKARITFEEWFLRFRIDGQKLNIDENIGLPFGWRTVNLGEVVDLKQGFALNKKSDHYIADKGLPLFKISDLLRETESLFVKNTIPKQFLVTEKEIIYTRTAQVGYVFMDRKGVVYNNCFKVIPKSCIYSRFIYQFLSLRSVRDLAQTLATGSAQPDLNHAAFKSIKTNYPTEEIVNKFNYMVEPIFENIQCLKKQNKLLKKSRDILLPRLMTGMIDVDKMDIEV